MIQKETVTKIVQEYLSETDVFLVDITVASGNRIVVEIDTDNAISIDFCIKLNKYIESKLDRDVEDYELEVGSFGLTEPFKILRQYKKNIGNEVEVLTKEGKKLDGILSDVTDEYFVLEQETMQKQEGVKRKVLVLEQKKFLYSEIKYTKYLIRFK